MENKIIICLMMSICFFSCGRDFDTKQIDSQKLSELLHVDLKVDSIKITCLEYPMPEKFHDNYLYYCKIEGKKEALLKIQTSLKIEIDSFGIDHSNEVARSFIYEFMNEQNSQSKYNWWKPCLNEEIYFSGFNRDSGLSNNTDGTGIIANLLCEDGLYLFFGKQSNMLGARE